MTQPLMQAHNEWAKRPDDERYTSLLEMADHFRLVRQQSRSLVASTRSIEVKPDTGNRLALYGGNGYGYEPTNWAFGQLCTIAEAPAGYLRTLPAEMSADCINYGLRFKRDIDDVGLLLQRNGDFVLRAATGPRYGRIWNSDVIDSLVNRFGDGVQDSSWRVPGEFGKAVSVTKENTTLYASDRDFFVFLCDEQHRIDFNGRTYARGFFTWNSEVGAATFGLATFLFDFVCRNRMIWGPAEYRELRIRHTASAPDRYIHELSPALSRYAESSSASITQCLEDAKADRLADVSEFLGKRFGARMVEKLQTIHKLEENRPIETRLDVVQAVTAYAKAIPFQDQRIDLERQAGELLNK